MEKQKISAVILAAGQSTRMGQTKQLLKLGDKCILEHVIDQLLKQKFDQIIVVLGHEAEKIRKSIPKKHTKHLYYLFNHQYRLGQSTSFLTAIRNVLPSVNSAMFFLGDQPFIKEITIETLLKKGNKMMQVDGSPFVIRPYHHDLPGHPIFIGNFRKCDFSTVVGDEGGRSLFKSTKKEAILIEDPGILFDIDTPADYLEALRKVERLKRVSYGGY
ncbi:nucleotidyltransferase family protein [Halalkalibacter alkalisediminis]|uniref:NTP transferase domain-containing protein n=1 Tax=Halalkalibacter alkalisediminis TaxID=935616 RepID=A0ABV6NE52_9BACI|nr:nucleotidyltransferase family protein [Halalkalibacter alkalisediminis]